MTCRFDDINNLFNKFAIDAFDIVSGAKEVEKEYKGFFGDSVREIYTKVVWNDIYTKFFVHDADRHEYGFADDVHYDKVFRFFLPLDALDELEKDYVSFEDLKNDKNALDNFLWKLGKFSNQEDFSSSNVGTLAGSNERSLVGINDNGENIYGNFFKPLREDEGFVIKGVKVPVSALNITPIPPFPREEVDKAIDNFDKEVKNYKKSKRIDKIQDVQYSVYKNKLYKYTGDFKYKDQIEEIMEELDWNLIAKMARIKYIDLESPKGNYLEENLILILKGDAKAILEELVENNCGRVSCGLFTAHNDGGCLSLDFTPEGWEGSDSSEVRTECTDLDRVKI